MRTDNHSTRLIGMSPFYQTRTHTRVLRHITSRINGVHAVMLDRSDRVKPDDGLRQRYKSWLGEPTILGNVRLKLRLPADAMRRRTSSVSPQTAQLVEIAEQEQHNNDH